MSKRNGKDFFDQTCSSLNIDLHLTDSQQAELFDRTATFWSSLGETEPYFAVWTDRRFKRDNLNDQTLAEFDLSGRRMANDLIGTILRNNNEYYCKDKALVEVGCGAGRITKHFSSEFSSVCACDVSVGQIDVARARVNNPSVEFRHISSLNSFEDLPDADVYYSAQVLQHNPPPS